MLQFVLMSDHIFDHITILESTKKQLFEYSITNSDFILLFSKGIILKFVDFFYQLCYNQTNCLCNSVVKNFQFYAKTTFFEFPFSNCLVVFSFLLKKDRVSHAQKASALQFSVCVCLEKGHQAKTNYCWRNWLIVEKHAVRLAESLCCNVSNF